MHHLDQPRHIETTPKSASAMPPAIVGIPLERLSDPRGYFRFTSSTGAAANIV